ncbi:reverse transcriptase domain protein [Colletotrichum abscissum]
MKKLRDIGTWEEVDRDPKQGIPLPLKWVYTYKHDADNEVCEVKARICVRGDMQPLDPLQNTYASTLAAKAFRLVMAIAAQFDLEADQYDAINAFLNAPLKSEKPVIVELPEGYKVTGKVGKLQRALYGLRDSPILWFQTFTSILRSMNMIYSYEEICIYQTADRKVMLVFYVDDFIVLYHRDDRETAQGIVDGIKEYINLKENGPINYFLGVRILRDRTARKVYLVHDAYIERVAKRFDLMDSLHPATPLPQDEFKPNEGQATKEEIKSYQEKVGSVLYTAIMIRPDVAFACSQLSRFLTNPSATHIKAINHCIRYLYATRYLALCYGSVPSAQSLLLAGDASFADDEVTRRSSQGYIMFLFGGPIQWKSARQATVTTSTTEAELLCLEETAKETMALKRLFKDIALDLGEVWSVNCDNQQTIRLVVGEGERIATRLRHIDIQNMWLRQEHARGSFEVAYMSTEDMPADGLTKNLSRAKFEHFRTLLNLYDAREVIMNSQNSQK